ncbi:hypothetical protein G9A89_000686 [Geosiphon pyriformis]|nr:hypothetical protein G9A89_000686 [Geosiphon pyriformis]
MNPPGRSKTVDPPPTLDRVGSDSPWDRQAPPPNGRRAYAPTPPCQIPIPQMPLLLGSTWGPVGPWIINLLLLHKAPTHPPLPVKAGLFGVFVLGVQSWGLVGGWWF